MGPIQRILWLQDVYKTYKRSAGTLGVALVLAEHANNETGLAWPSLSTIAHKAALDRRTACRCLQRLLRDGFLKKLEKGGPGNKSTTYRLIHIVATQPLGVVAERTPGSGCAVTKVVAAQPPEPSKNLVRTNARPREGQLKEPRWKAIASHHWPWYARQLGKDGSLKFLNDYRDKNNSVEILSAAWRTATEEQRLRVRLEADQDEGVAA